MSSLASPADDLDGGGTGHADVADGFQLGRGVDIGDDGIGGILLPQVRDEGLVHLLGHRTARVLHRKQHALFGRKNLDRFGHEPHAAHQHRARLRLRGLHAELEGIAHEVGHL